MLQDQWFIVQTHPQRENFVSERLKALDPYLPRFKTTKGRIAALFAGYLFVPKMRDWSPITNTVGVRCLLKTGDQPACISGGVIANWRAKERGGLVQLPPPPRFAPGQRLTILRGSLKHRVVIYAGMSGRDRERVLIEMLGQNVTLLVATTDLAPEIKLPPRNRLRSHSETLRRDSQTSSSRSHW
jgi:transcription antitermination factor NusG